MLIMVKPGFADNHYIVSDIIKRAGFIGRSLMAARRRRLQYGVADTLYSEHGSQPWHRDNCLYMSCRDVLIMEFTGSRHDSLVTEIREKWGVSQTFNVIHCSRDADEELERGILLGD